tara:strand:+ start:257 stop:1228 length:972 start_codon:yes stop_codon:yes gene_type:complete
MNGKLGKLEKVELRDIWESESTDFTPWLAKEENIQLLGSSIGIDLVVEKVEQQVGPFRADILCRDEGNDNLVLIENQLEKTDHKHLGQLLTYATGTKSVSIVWVAADFTDEHRAALDWLNSITDENFNFFGLEVELYKIGNSPVAPHFKVICQPNDWSKSISTAERNIAKEGISLTKQKQLAFWTELAKKINESDSKLRPRKASPRPYINIPIGTTGFGISCTINTISNTLCSQIYISNNKEAFKAFENEKGKIENEFGEKLNWELLPLKAASRIAIYRPDSILDEEDDWNNMTDWLIMKAEKLYSVFSHRIKNLELDELEQD